MLSVAGDICWTSSGEEQMHAVLPRSESNELTTALADRLHSCLLASQSQQQW